MARRDDASRIRASINRGANRYSNTPSILRKPREIGKAVCDFDLVYGDGRLLDGGDTTLNNGISAGKGNSIARLNLTRATQRSIDNAGFFLRNAGTRDALVHRARQKPGDARNKQSNDNGNEHPDGWTRDFDVCSQLIGACGSARFFPQLNQWNPSSRKSKQTSFTVNYSPNAKRMHLNHL